MSLILNIDTAIDTAYVTLAKNGEIIAQAINQEQKDHGRFLQPAIQMLLANAQLSMQELEAVAVAGGPGSYTGLRVGMASVKGLCYALQKPLIIVDSLEILAYAAILETNTASLADHVLFCPMIDARRMEVFTSLYDQHLQPLLAPVAMILDPHSFAKSLLKNKIVFFGNGAEKWKLICSDKNALFTSITSNALAMNKLAYKKYLGKEFTDAAYAEPLYLKEFFAGPPPH